MFNYMLNKYVLYKIDPYIVYSDWDKIYLSSALSICLVAIIYMLLRRRTYEQPKNEYLNDYHKVYFTKNGKALHHSKTCHAVKHSDVLTYNVTSEFLKNLPDKYNCSTCCIKQPIYYLSENGCKFHKDHSCIGKVYIPIYLTKSEIEIITKVNGFCSLC
jgi:hypothetical protein